MQYGPFLVSFLIAAASAFTPKETANIGNKPAASTILEWERRAELDRRVEDGMDYVHFPETTVNRQWHQRRADDDIPRVQGVFCGYKTTAEEYNRLKSAHVD